jgi:hypothetical protein
MLTKILDPLFSYFQWYREKTGGNWYQIRANSFCPPEMTNKADFYKWKRSVKLSSYDTVLKMESYVK